MIKGLVPKNPNRNSFFKDLDTLPIEIVKKKYIHTSFIKKTLTYIKPICFRLGIFQNYLKIKKILISPK